MQKNDISPLMAIGLLVCFLLMLFGLSNYQFISLNWSLIQKAFQTTQGFLLIVLSSFATNTLIVMLILERLFGYKKQGSRLRSIKKDKMSRKKAFSKVFSKIFSKIFLCLLLSYLFWRPIESYVENSILFYRFFLSETTLWYIIRAFCGSLLLSLVIGFYGLLSALLAIKSLFKLDKTLPRGSLFRGYLTLGSIGEESGTFDKIQHPKWLAIPKKALNGNILITGSIGTGKTQGTILNYVDQLFSQFSHQPAALVLDPKGSFIEKVAKILKEKGLSDKCVYLGDAHANI